MKFPQIPQGYKDIKLETLNNGAVLELFEREFREVMKNISDVNTSYREPRVINLKIEIKPTEERNIASVITSAKSTLAPYKSLTSTMLFEELPNGSLRALESNMSQPSLNFDNVEFLEPKMG